VPSAAADVGGNLTSFDIDIAPASAAAAAASEAAAIRAHQ